MSRSQNGTVSPASVSPAQSEEITVQETITQADANTDASAIAPVAPAPVAPAMLDPKSLDSHLTTKDVKWYRYALDIYKPYRDAKGNHVSRSTMQAEIFRVLASLPKGRTVTITATVDGTRVSRTVQKHMSTKVESGRVYGEVSFTFTMPDGNKVSAEIPVYRIVAVEGVADGKGKEYTY